MAIVRLEEDRLVLNMPTDEAIALVCLLGSVPYDGWKHVNNWTDALNPLSEDIVRAIAEENSK